MQLFSFETFSLNHFQIHSNVKLQIAATFCVSNLLWNDQEGDSSGRCITLLGENAVIVEWNYGVIQMFFE